MIFQKNSKIIQFNKQPKINTKGEHVRMWYSNGSHSEIEVAHKYEDWTPESIRERWLHLLGFMEKRWNIDFWWEKKKEELLFLDNFLESLLWNLETKEI